MINKNISSSHERDKNGNVLGGHGTRKKKRKGGGGITTCKIEGHFSSSENGVEGSVASEVPIVYRSFAQTGNGEILHTIVIHSDYEIKNGRIDLLIGGEQTDDKIRIVSCSSGGNIRDNTISGLNIAKGKNVLKVKFADKMKHAIKLNAYEFK